MEETTNKRHRLTGQEGKKFTSEYQPTPEAKSEGWKKRNAREKLIEDLAEELLKVGATKLAVTTETQNAEQGNASGLIKLLSLIKLPDKQEFSGNMDFTQLVVRKLDENKNNGNSGAVSSVNKAEKTE